MSRSALIVAHGQPSEPDPAEAALAELARAVSALLPGWTVRSATLAAAGRLEAALEELPDMPLLYPMFMAKGWFVTSALPERLGDRPARVLEPLGLDGGLVGLGAETIRSAVSRLGWPLTETEVVLAAHGSGRSREPARIASEYAAALSRDLGCPVRPGFVEETPSVQDAATGLGPQSICLPFFARPGGHAQQDVPRALGAAGFRGHLLPVLGALPTVPALIAGSLGAASRDRETGG